MNKQQRHINKAVKRLKNKGSRYFKRGKFEKAVEIFTRAVELNPNNAKAYKCRADVYFVIEPKKAIQDCTKAIKLKPNYISAYKIRALTNSSLLYNEENTTILDYKSTISDYTTILKYNPNYFDAYELRGHIYHNTKQYNLAIKDYTKAIALKPQKFELYIYRGQDYREMQDYDKAIKDFNTALEIYDKYYVGINIKYRAYISLGETYNLLKDYNKAIEFYTKAIEILGPTDELIKCYKNRSDMYLQIKETEKARVDLVLMSITKLEKAKKEKEQEVFYF